LADLQISGGSKRAILDDAFMIFVSFHSDTSGIADDIIAPRKEARILGEKALEPACRLRHRLHLLGRKGFDALITSVWAL